MTCDEPLVMEELVVAQGFVHADSLADELDRDRVARGADRHQSVVGNPACLHLLIVVRRPGPQRRELFMGEAIDRSFVGRAVDAQIGDLDAPTLEPIVEIVPRTEAPARQRVALYILDAILALALGARPIGLAGARGEAVIARKILEQRMPQHLMLAASQYQVARIIVQTTQGHAAKPAKGMLMAVEQAGQPLMAISARV